MQPQLRPWVQWAQDGAAAMQNMWLQGPTSRAISRTKNRAIPGAIRMVLHSLAAVLVWLKGGGGGGGCSCCFCECARQELLVAIACCRSLGYDQLLATVANPKGKIEASLACFWVGAGCCFNWFLGPIFRAKKGAIFGTLLIVA